jgi:hypothetical protein
MDEIRSALCKRLIELGDDPAKVSEKAAFMISNWWEFSSHSMDDRGHETCRDWMDPEIVRFLDKALEFVL